MWYCVRAACPPFELPAVSTPLMEDITELGEVIGEEVLQ